MNDDIDKLFLQNGWEVMEASTPETADSKSMSQLNSPTELDRLAREVIMEALAGVRHPPVDIPDEFLDNIPAEALARMIREARL